MCLIALGCSSTKKYVPVSGVSVPQNAPLTSYGSPFDSFGRLTAWPRDPALEKVDLSVHDSKLPVPVKGQKTVFYRLMGRLIGGKLKIDVHQIMPAALLALIEWPDRAVCPGRPRGEAILPGNTPIEFVFWRAVDDMFLQGPLLGKEIADNGQPGKTSYDLQTQKKAYRGRRFGEWVETTRELMTFRIGKGFECQSQKRTFKLVRGALNTPDLRWSQADSLDIVRSRGDVMAEMYGEGGTDAATYTLKMHIGMDIDALYGNGQTYDWVLRCRSDRPIFAARVGGVCFTLHTGDGATWVGTACPCNSR